MTDNPFPGLRPFEAPDSHLFFGRETATDELLKKLRHRRFIAVVGTSGSGKSSLVKAGVLPDLYGGGMAAAGSRWRVALFRPGDAPLAALALALCDVQALASTTDPALQHSIIDTVLRRGSHGLTDVVRQTRLNVGENLLIVVDQFEELFRTRQSGAQDADEQQAFVKLLLQAARQSEQPIYVMLTMRSEYLGECTRFRDLPEAINEGQYLIPRMNRDQRRQAILGPVSVAGATLSPPLLQRLLNDVGESPDQLPIMQHAMMRTWDIWAAEQQPDQAIDIAHYEATGTMTEALSRHADEIYFGLAGDGQRLIAEHAFKRLTGLGPDQREMRYPGTMAELCAVCACDSATMLPVIDAFRQPGRSLLMPPSDTRLDDASIIDIAHESLIRIWRRLQTWVDEEAQSVRIYRRLAEDAELHQQGDQGLRRNPELAIASNWRSRTHPNATWAGRYHPGFALAMAFLERSQAVARRRKVAALGAAIVVPLLILGGIAAFAIDVLNQQNEELNQENEEFATALDNVQEQLASDEAQQDSQPPDAVHQSDARQPAPAADQQPVATTPLAATAAAADAAQTLTSDSAAPGTDKPTGVTATADPTLGQPAAMPSVADTQARLTEDPSMTLQRQMQSWETFSAQHADETQRQAAQQQIQTIAEALKHSASIVSADNFVTCENVKRLEPVRVSDQFSLGRVYMLARVNAPKTALLTINWLREDGTVLDSRQTRVQPNTGRGFRTFSWKTITEPGRYAVQLLNENRQVIGYRPFRVR